MVRSLNSLILLFVFTVFSCDVIENKKLQNVTYYTPVYATTEDLASRVAVEDPKEYSESGKIITYNDFVFINEPMKGIHIIDNADPSNPQNIGFINVEGNIDMAIIDNHLYADMFSALVVMDISDVTNPVIIEDYTVEDVFYYDRYWAIEDIAATTTYDYNVRYESVDDSKGIVVDWEVEVRREEVSDEDYYLEETAFLQAETTDTSVSTNAGANVSTAGSMARFLPVGNMLYVINFNELILLQIDASYKPNRWGKLDTGTIAETLFQLNELLFVGSVNGMLMYDVSDPQNPSFINKIEHFRSCDPVVADASYAYVTLRGGTNCFTETNELQIINIQNPESLSVVSRHVMFNPHGLAVREDHLIVCDGSAGIKVVDISNRSEPKIVETYPIGFAYDVIVQYPNALVVGENTLYQYDISELPVMKLSSEIQVSSKRSF